MKAKTKDNRQNLWKYQKHIPTKPSFIFKWEYCFYCMYVKKIRNIYLQRWQFSTILLWYMKRCAAIKFRLKGTMHTLSKFLMNKN